MSAAQTQSRETENPKKLKASLAKPGEALLTSEGVSLSVLTSGGP